MQLSNVGAAYNPSAAFNSGCIRQDCALPLDLATLAAPSLELSQKPLNVSTHHLLLIRLRILEQLDGVNFDARISLRRIGTEE